MSHFTELRHELENYLDSEDVEKIHKAYSFAFQAHKGQQRQSGDPYITHPLAVAHILAEMRMDAQTIIAAILHDVIEDTPIEKNVLIEEFGQEVAELVDGVSKLTQVQFRNRQEAQAENFRKMLLAMAKDIRVILIKLADRLHNMRTLSSLPSSKRHRIAKETMEIYAPIANRLGMHAIRVEFEDLGFAALYPLRYRVLQEEIIKAKKSRKKITGQIEGDLKEVLEKSNLPPSVVWGHTKHTYSVYKEMKAKHLSFSELMDVYTFCIVVDSVDTCYRALGAVHSLYKPLPEKFRDYIALPKANSYQALHTTLFGPYGVPISVQIRTVDMDNKADNGIATYWLYSSPEDAIHPAHVKAGEWLKRLLDIQQRTIENPLEFMENVKIDLFPEEVYVFTPNGEILELPRGATPIDFAYAIHSDLGDTCVGARIDRRVAPLSTLLANGQTVEIITSPEAKPNPSWLHFVVSGKARSNIRHFLKNQHQEEAVILGKRLLEAALAGLGQAWSSLSANKIETLLQQCNYKSEAELFESIGLGNNVAPLIAQRLANHDAAKNIQKSDNSPSQPLMIKGTEGVLLHFAECCRPIPGDPIIGISNSGVGLTIHMQDCKNAHKFSKYIEKIVPVQWEPNIVGQFKTFLRIEVINQPGVLAQLASAIAMTNANIDNVTVEERDGKYSVVNLILSVSNRKHLAQVMRRLRSIKAVTRLNRGKQQEK